VTITPFKDKRKVTDTIWFV